ncbi:MAG TPA: PhoPQ-activated protein PqaA family protein [Gammaproteobacteria bacterium]|nr:PhoPQ-activated protein PqaA family protein [Gammaproteobacteria bacterium]
MRAALVGFLLCLFGGSLGAAPNSPPDKALRDYVSAADPSFAWQVHARYNILGADIVELHLSSQTWQHVLWKHQLYLIRPKNIKPDVDEGLFVIAGGRWRDSYDTASAPELPSSAAVFVAIAQQLGTVVAVLAQDPFQPMFGLREDELIAYSFSRYLETGDADWPLLLPMVKAAVKGMDAVQSFTSGQWGLKLSRFAVIGGSKRGWATWLTGAVDPRVVTLIPIVIDVLNFEAQMPHQIAIWGAPSEELEPYTKRGLLKLLSSDAGSALRRIVDPYSYRDRLTQPKLIVIGTNDAYFPIDALNLYWNGLRGQKYVLYVPNNGHNVDDFGRLIPTVAAMNRQAEGKGRMPDLAWQFANDGATLRLCMRADPAPTRVVLWSAQSSDSDFRDAQFSSRPVGLGKGGDEVRPGSRADGGARIDRAVYEARLEPPASGYEAVFAELTFAGGGGPYTLSTNVRIIDSSGRPPAFSAAVDGVQGVCSR